MSAGLSKSRTELWEATQRMEERSERKSRPLASLPTWGLCFWCPAFISLGGGIVVGGVNKKGLEYRPFL